jgi:hypothetical protein
MPEASGSIAFLGAARFQGYWDAASNAATGSGVTGAPTGPIGALFASGTSAGGGYSNYDGLTASVGDYWQVTGSGTHNVEGATNWALNDWVIYSGSAGAVGSWMKLDYTDTIASIVLGNLSGETTFNLTGSSDKQILFITGASDTDVVQSGSDNFSFDYINSNLHLTGNLSVSDNKNLYFGSGHDASIEYDEDGTDELRFAGAAATFEQDVTFDNNVTLGVAATDVTTVTGRLTASVGAMIPDDVKLYFGSGEESHIEYNENGDDHLTLSGTTGVALSGSLVTVDASSSGQIQLTASHLDLSAATLTLSGTSWIELKTDALIIGEGSATDPYVLFDGGTNDGRLDWMEDEDYFRFRDSVEVTGTLGVSGVGTFNGSLTASSGIELGDAAYIDGYVYHKGDLDTYIAFALDDNVVFNAGGDVFMWYKGGVYVQKELVIAPDGGTKFSTDVILQDDKRIHFGSGSVVGGESYIEYDEAGGNYMVISGSGTGLQLKGSNVVVDSSVTSISGTVEISGSTSGDLLTLYNAVDNGEFIKCVTGDTGTSIELNGQVGGGGLIKVFDDNSTARIHLAGDQGNGRVYLYDMGGEYIEGDGTNLTIKADGIIELSGSSIGVPDDTRLTFGNAQEAHIEYDEAGDDYLTISGSANGVAISGSSVIVDGNLLPNADAVTDLGSASKRWANIYTGDLHLRNERGDWTIVEEEDYLTIVNNKKGKKYKFVLEEID